MHWQLFGDQHTTSFDFDATSRILQLEYRITLMKQSVLERRCHDTFLIIITGIILSQR